MSLTLSALVGCLGQLAQEAFTQAPFAGRTFEWSVEEDLDPVRVDYTSPEGGSQFVCDADDRVTTIFLSFDDRAASDDLVDLPWTFTREQVIAELGTPTKSGAPHADEILGQYGAWDRFDRSGYTLHVEHRFDAVGIRRITLMRADVAP